MSMELIYTSVPRGLRPGSSGFCAAAKSANMPAALEERLELLSGYRAIYPAGHMEEGRNPISYAHWRVTCGKTYSVLSRVAFAGLDYTRRPSKFAHHLVLEAPEQTEAGPAWMMMQPGLMEERWSGEPRELDSGRQVPTGENPARICTHWEQATGDAGWAGVLAEAFVVDPSRPAYVIYPLGLDMLALIDEAIALLPAELRWRVTFNTYFTDLPADARCAWRCVVAATAAAKDAPRYATSGVIIDLTKKLGEAPQCGYVELARTGIYQPEMPLEIPLEEPEPVLAAAREREEYADAQASFDDEGEEQTWMPEEPQDAEPAPKPSRPARTRSHAPDNRGASWATTLLACAVVAGGIYAWHAHQRTQDRQAVEGRLFDAGERLSAAQEQFRQEQERAATLSVDQRDLSRRLATLQVESQQLKTERDDAQRQVMEMQSRLDQLKQELAKVVESPPRLARLKKENAELTEKINQLDSRLKQALAAASKVTHGPDSPFLMQSARVVVNDRKLGRGFSRASVIRPGQLLELRAPAVQPVGWRISPAEKKDRLILASMANPDAVFTVGMNSVTGETESDWPDVRRDLRTKATDAQARQKNAAALATVKKDELARLEKARAAEQGQPKGKRDDQLLSSYDKAMADLKKEIADLTKEADAADQEAKTRLAAVAALDALEDPITLDVFFGGIKVGTLTVVKEK